MIVLCILFGIIFATAAKSMGGHIGGWFLVGLLFLPAIRLLTIMLESAPEGPNSSSPALPGPQPQKTFVTKVAGVSKRNKDRTSRQKILRELAQDDFCEHSEELTLEREPDNPHDENAIRVLIDDGRQIGYIRGHVAHDLARKMDDGHRVTASILEITGGDEDFPTFGCTIEVAIYPLLEESPAEST